MQKNASLSVRSRGPDPLRFYRRGSIEEGMSGSIEEGMIEGGSEAEARAVARQNRWQGNGEQTARQCRTGTSFQGCGHIRALLLKVGWLLCLQATDRPDGHDARDQYVGHKRIDRPVVATAGLQIAAVRFNCLGLVKSVEPGESHCSACRGA